MNMALRRELWQPCHRIHSRAFAHLARGRLPTYGRLSLK